MRWWVFVPLALVCSAMDQALMPVLSLGGFWPSLSAVLVAWVALHASRSAALWGALLVGTLADCQAPAIMEGHGVVVIGPHMLAYALSALAVVELRDMLFRRNAGTLAASSATVVLAQSLVFLAVAGVRVVYADPTPLWGAGTGAQAFGHDVVNALYTGLVALPLAWPLARTQEGWGFAQGNVRFRRGFG